MTSPFRAYFERSVQVLKQNSAKVLNANPSPNLKDGHLIFSMSKATKPDLNIKDYATGCDGDIGGLSTCTLDLDEGGDARFWGELRLGVKREYEGKVRGGYAGFRNKNLPTMFGALHHDLSLYTHLAITLRPSGEPATLKHWFVNIQTDGPVRSDLFQHRLPLSTTQLLQGKGYNQWQKVHVPLNGFVLTNSGTLSDTQIPMMKNKIRTVGFSILGGGREPGGPSTGLETGRRGSYPELDMVEDDLTPEAKEARNESLRPTSLRPDEKSTDEDDHGAAMLGGIEGKFELGIREVRAVNLDVDSNGEAGVDF